MCWPYFDSPSVFCRILDKEKGGHFTIGPTGDDSCTTKQQYLPVSNVLQTRYLKEEGVMNVVDFFPRPNDKSWDAKYHANVVASNHTGSVPERPDLKKWLVRRVECMRGKVDVCVEVFPAFNYAQDKHTTEIADMGRSAHESSSGPKIYPWSSMRRSIVGMHPTVYAQEWSSRSHQSRKI